MNSTALSTGPSGMAWKIPVIALSYFVAETVSGGIVTALGMAWPNIPQEMTSTAVQVGNAIGSILMAGCLAWLAIGLRGGTAIRWIVLAVFAYVTFGLNNQIEAAIFTTFGGFTTMVVFLVLPCLGGAAAATLLLRSSGPPPAITTVFRDRPASAWWWRLLVAWLGFPVIYTFFGMLVSPIVVPLYQQQEFGLTLPTMGTLIQVLLGRSALYLAVTLPVIALWGRSRRSLALALATAFFAMMGLIGLLTTTFLPPVLRITHSVEILADAVVYAGLLVLLFVPSKVGARAPERMPVTAE
jgi:hypothetical protein